MSDGNGQARTFGADVMGGWDTASPLTPPPPLDDELVCPVPRWAMPTSAAIARRAAAISVAAGRR